MRILGTTCEKSLLLIITFLRGTYVVNLVNIMCALHVKCDKCPQIFYQSLSMCRANIYFDQWQFELIKFSNQDASGSNPGSSCSVYISLVNAHQSRVQTLTSLPQNLSPSSFYCFLFAPSDLFTWAAFRFFPLLHEFDSLVNIYCVCEQLGRV